MGLRETVQSAVGAGFQALGDLAETATLRHRTEHDYDPQLGHVTEDFEDDAISAVFTGYAQREIDGEAVLPEDIRATVLASTVASAPAIKDIVVRADGTSRRVINVSVDPVGATYTLQLRRAA